MRNALVRSSTNADLAPGSDRVLVIVPSMAGQPDPFSRLDDEIERLEPTLVRVVYADAASSKAFGTNPFGCPAKTREPKRKTG